MPDVSGWLLLAVAYLVTCHGFGTWLVIRARREGVFKNREHTRTALAIAIWLAWPLMLAWIGLAELHRWTGREP